MHAYFGSIVIIFEFQTYIQSVKYFNYKLKLENVYIAIKTGFGAKKKKNFLSKTTIGIKFDGIYYTQLNITTNFNDINVIKSFACNRKYIL